MMSQVATIRTIQLGRKYIMESPCEPDATLSKQLVHVSCDLSGMKPLGSAIVGVQDLPESDRVGLRLESKCEVREWHESSRTETDNRGKKNTQYSYARDWSTKYIESSSFHDPTACRAGLTLPLSQETAGKRAERGLEKERESRENERECVRDTVADNDTKMDTRTHIYTHSLSLQNTKIIIQMLTQSHTNKYQHKLTHTRTHTHTHTHTHMHTHTHTHACTHTHTHKRESTASATRFTSQAIRCI